MLAPPADLRCGPASLFLPVSGHRTNAVKKQKADGYQKYGSLSNHPFCIRFPNQHNFSHYIFSYCTKWVTLVQGGSTKFSLFSMFCYFFMVKITMHYCNSLKTAVHQCFFDIFLTALSISQHPHLCQICNFLRHLFNCFFYFVTFST